MLKGKCEEEAEEEYNKTREKMLNDPRIENVLAFNEATERLYGCQDEHRSHLLQKLDAEILLSRQLHMV